MSTEDNQCLDLGIFVTVLSGLKLFEDKTPSDANATEFLNRVTLADTPCMKSVQSTYEV